MPGQPSVIALNGLHVDDVTCRNDGRVTGLVGRQRSLDDQSLLKYARSDTRQDFSARFASGDCQILLPCAGMKMVRTKGAQRPAMPPWSLRIRAWHDNKLDDDTVLGAFERDPCIACFKITSPCQLCPMCLLNAHDDCTHQFTQTELEKRIAKDSEAFVFEQETRKFSRRGGRSARGGMNMPRFALCVARC